ncbi:hypothetical protein KCV06_g24, partial [Aureobasidium melanogenum]
MSRTGICRWTRGKQHLSGTSWGRSPDGLLSIWAYRYFPLGAISTQRGFWVLLMAPDSVRPHIGRVKTSLVVHREDIARASMVVERVAVHIIRRFLACQNENCTRKEAVSSSFARTSKVIHEMGSSLGISVLLTNFKVKASSSN